MKAIYFLFLTILLLSITQSSFSEIYKWVDQDGNVKFSDKKPQEGNQAEKIKLKINTVKVPKIYNNSSAYDDTSVSSPGKKVIMYSASWCGVCKTAKKYFKQQGIPYQEYDVEKSAKGRQDYKRLHGKGVPIILVGKMRMDGFDRSYFDKLYRG